MTTPDPQELRCAGCGAEGHAPVIVYDKAAAIEKGLRRLCHELCRDFEPELLVFERVAVTEEEIGTWNLPTRPTKRQGNPHANGWPDGRPSVELDAFAATDLRNLVRFCIEDHVDQSQLNHLRTVEAAEREQLALFGQQVAGAAP